MAAKIKAKTKAKPKAKSSAKSVKAVPAKPKPKAKIAQPVKAKSKAKTAKPPVVKSKAKVAAPVKAKVIAKPTFTKVKPAPKSAPKVASKVSVTSKAKEEKKSVTNVIDIAKAKPKTKTKPRSSSAAGGPVDFAPYREAKGEEYMNAQQVEHFRKILRDWLMQLREEVDNTMVHMQEEAGTYPDPVDRAAQEEGFNLELRARDRERRLIKKIEQALDDLDHNDYGYCKDCAAEIGIRRLEARPTADKCIDCKTFEEIREKQIGG